MANEPINSWDQAVLVAGEATFGTTPNPAGSQALEVITLKAGPVEEGNTRGKKDRGVGRGMQDAFVVGRVQPGAFTLDTSWKSRADADDVPKEAALLKAAGLKETISAATSVTYSPVADPQASGDFVAASLYRAFGKPSYVSAAEQMRGCVVKSLKLSGGDTELMLSAAGEWIGKYALGKVDSVTLADGSTTSLTLTAEQSKRVGPGWYQIENEIVKVTDSTYGATTRTITRGALSSTGAAHTGAAMVPYLPSLTLTGSPISEANATLTLDSLALEVQSWQFDFTSGIDLRAGATGSAYSQGAKVLRYDASLTAKVMMTREQLSLAGRVKNNQAVACVVTQGTGAGGIFTLNAPYAQVKAFEIPDTNNDIAIVDIGLRLRDSSAGNDMFSIVLT